MIADDSAHFRRGLRRAIETSGAAIEVVAEAEDGAAAVEAVHAHHPDVVLLDVRMPVHGGINAAQAIADSGAGCRVLMLTISDELEDMAMAAKAGAAGYLQKDRSFEDVTEAIMTLAAGRVWPVGAS